MKILSFLRKLYALIICFGLITIGVLIWDWQQINKPYEISNEFHQYVATIDEDLLLTVERYLLSRNISDWYLAIETIAYLEENRFDWLSPEDNQAIQEHTQIIKEVLAEFKDAEKLLNNPQLLMINNEREREQELRLLLNHLENANLEDTRPHLTTLLKLSNELNALSRARYNFFNSPGKTHEKALLTKNDEVSLLLQQLEAQDWERTNSIPLAPGSVDSAADDLVEEAIQSLQSLTKRYQRELTNTIKFQNQVDSVQHRLFVAIDDLHQQLGLYYQIIDGIKQDIVNRVAWTLFFAVLAVAVTLIVLLLVQRTCVNFLIKIERFLTNMVDGNYSQEFTFNSRFDELESARNSALTLQQHLSMILDELRDEVGKISEAARDFRADTKQSIAFAESQQQVTEDVVDSVTQLSLSFQSVAANAEQASTSTIEVDAATVQASERLCGAVAGTRQLADDILKMKPLMTQLEENGQNIDNVLNVIQEVADQTNLLALNAAIEAARAGEYGRGFAVVADEVRQLAQRTANSTDEIHEIINDQIRMTNEASCTVKQHSDFANSCVADLNEALGTIEPVISDVHNISNMNNQIAEATRVQAAVATDIAGNVDKIKEHTKLVNFTMTAIKNAGETLTSTSSKLTKLSSELHGEIIENGEDIDIAGQADDDVLF